MVGSNVVGGHYTPPGNGAPQAEDPLGVSFTAGALQIIDYVFPDDTWFYSERAVNGTFLASLNTL